MTPCRVAVTGLGVVAPGAADPLALWDRLHHPPPPEPGPYPHGDWRGFFLHPDATCTGIALDASRQALAGPPGPPPWVLVGSCSAGMRESDEAWAPAEAGLAVAPERVLWPQLPHRPALELRRALGLQTPAWTVSTACTSGAVALGAAAELVASGRAPRVLVVGVDLVAKLTWFGFGSLGLQATGRCRPFGRERTGLNLGEAAAALVLEPVEAALARGASIHGYVAGYGNATDAYHMSSPEPSGAGAERAIRRALGETTEIGWINAHGTGTLLNDEIEARLLSRLFPGTPITANKGALGHTLGAAGAVEALLTLVGLGRGEIPPSVPVDAPEQGIDLVQAPRRCDHRYALSVNLAFGGSNTALLLEAP